MEESKELAPIVIPLSDLDKMTLSKEPIIFMDYSPSIKYLLLLSSNNTIFLGPFLENTFKIEKKLKNIINDFDNNIINCYFCNETKDSLLLLCDDFNIYEYDLNREYINHVYYNVLGNSFIFKMNWQKNSNPKEGIKNFCIFKDKEINVWNTLNDNKSNVLSCIDINCFSYDCSGIAIYFLGKRKDGYYISVIKFVNEYDFKELYFKPLNFIETNIDINYLDIFDDNFIMCDSNYNIYILKNYPLDKINFIMSLNNKNKQPLLFFPFIGKIEIFQFGILYVNLNEGKKNILNVCYDSNKCNIVESHIEIQKVNYYKEYNNNKSELLSFDDTKKELKKYLL